VGGLSSPKRRPRTLVGAQLRQPECRRQLLAALLAYGGVLAGVACAGGAATGPAAGLPDMSHLRDVTVAGVERLSGPLSVRGRRVTLVAGSLIVTNGHSLSIIAEEVIIGQDARIASFEEGAANRELGRPGRPAGTVFIGARHLSGGMLAIRNVGQDGGAGKPGAAGHGGREGTQGAARSWNPWNGCTSGSDGGRGGQGDLGGDGENGGAGGNGGTVVLAIPEGPTVDSVFNIDVRGGKGGMGGPAGAGGPGGKGGAGGSGTAACGGTSPGPPGETGQPGRQGLPGPDGALGKVVDLRTQ
jgi:hypothetical protein